MITSIYDVPYLSKFGLAGYGLAMIMIMIYRPDFLVSETLVPGV